MRASVLLADMESERKFSLPEKNLSPRSSRFV